MNVPFFFLGGPFNGRVIYVHPERPDHVLRDEPPFNYLSFPGEPEKIREHLYLKTRLGIDGKSTYMFTCETTWSPMKIFQFLIQQNKV